MELAAFTIARATRWRCARLMQSILTKPELYETLIGSLPSYKTLGGCSHDHLALYRQFLQ